MIQRIIQWYIARRKRVAVARLRQSMLSLGYDLSRLSNEEIEEGVKAISEGLMNSGFLAIEAANGLRRLASAAKA